MAKAVKFEVEALREGDIVDVVAPGFPCNHEAVEAAKKFLEEKGFKPRIPKEIVEDHPLFANSDKKRIQMLIKALKAQDSKAIWCLRGGYGSNHLLPALRRLKKQKPKIMIGISDITSLHGFLIQNWKWTGLHGPLLDRFGKGLVPKDVEEEMFQVVKGEISEVKFTNLEALNKAAKKKKKITAPVMGGNMVVVNGHLGTVDEIKFAKKIVFFEETGERGYRVDRMLFHLDQCGALKNCKAVVFGTFLGGDEPKVDPDSPTVNKINWVLENWAKDKKFPVLKGLPCGHDTVQRVLPLGTKAVLETGKKNELRVMTGVKK